jgi:hypothetical protein
MNCDLLPFLLELNYWVQIFNINAIATNVQDKYSNKKKVLISLNIQLILKTFLSIYSQHLVLGFYVSF